MEPVIPTIIIEPDPYRPGSLQQPHTAFEKRGRYVWGYVVHPNVNWRLMSLPESNYHRGAFADLANYFRLPTTQELLDLFDHKTGECRLPLLQGFLETRFDPGISFWAGEQLFNPADSQTRAHVVTTYGELSVEWETSLAFPLYVHVNEHHPMKRLIQPGAI